MHLCRFCRTDLKTTFVDLGMSPIANDFVAPERALAMEPFYPLHALVCESCWLVQLIDFEKAEAMFSDEYAYFSSYSTSWLEHARSYAETMIAEEGLGPDSLVVEVASNDGYLLRWFKQAGVPVYGVEPTRNTAEAARRNHGIDSEHVFFGRETAQALRDRGLAPDVMAANNVLAHVPDINDFVGGFKILLKPGGVATFEFPHLLNLIQERQFDTIYHEHFSYLSLGAVQRILDANGLRAYDVQTLTTHGGSLRLFVCHADDGNRPTRPSIAEMASREAEAGLFDIAVYERFSDEATRVKADLLAFLVEAWRTGKTVAGYGAPAKGNTLLNFAGVKPDLVAFTVDRSPEKQGRLLPGVRIPILPPEAIAEHKPDYVLILPWNLKDEIAGQMASIRDWGGRFVTAIPGLTVW